MKTVIKLFLILSILSTNANADIAIEIKGGDRAPFSGMLMDAEKSNKIRIQLLEGDYNKALAESYLRSIDRYKQNEKLYEERSALLLNQNSKLIDQIKVNEASDTLSHILWIGAGMAITVLGGLIVKQASK